MTLTQSEPSTRRSTLLLHRSHAIKSVRRVVSVREETIVGLDTIKVTLVHSISSGSCRQRQKAPGRRKRRM